ncbi:unnamed protein product [Mytilus coruscus]|uniref:Uncharacterized protein n=1 Tax=Mytilus coruscus TaxID=42192 RepID=A0A6J7ZUL6_MYTCO|nr:unnamed protein product [Mytilus coruscus]
MNLVVSSKVQLKRQKCKSYSPTNFTNELKVWRPKTISELSAKATSRASIYRYFDELDRIMEKYERKDKPQNAVLDCHKEKQNPKYLSQCSRHLKCAQQRAEDEDDLDDDDTLCCVCNMWQLKKLQECNSIVFTQWAKCKFLQCELDSSLILL